MPGSNKMLDFSHRKSEERVSVEEDAIYVWNTPF